MPGPLPLLPFEHPKTLLYLKLQLNNNKMDSVQFRIISKSSETEFYENRLSMSKVGQKRSDSCSAWKWAGMCRYTVPEFIFVPEFHTSILYTNIYIFFLIFFSQHIIVSLLRIISEIPSFHFDHWTDGNGNC
jgi:hypothetical protein